MRPGLPVLVPPPVPGFTRIVPVPAIVVATRRAAPPLPPDPGFQPKAEAPAPPPLALIVPLKVIVVDKATPPAPPPPPPPPPVTSFGAEPPPPPEPPISGSSVGVPYEVPP